jgi:putative hemolysin
VALIHGFEKALKLLSESQLEKEVEEGNKQSEKLLYLMEHQAAFTCMRVILMFLAGLYAGVVLWPERGTHWKYYFLPLGFFLGMLVFCVMIPRKSARYYLEFWTRKCLGIVRLFITILKPIIVPAMLLADFILFITGKDPRGAVDNVTEEDIVSMVNEGHEQGVIESREAEMITNIFELDDKEAHDIMTHRTNIIAIDGDSTLEEAIQFVLSETNSRFPVYDKELDDVIGILNLRDLMVCKSDGKAKIKEIEGLVREPYFVPETRKVDDLLKEMQKQQLHMAIVFDEYGQVAGLVTMEDIIEEIVGNIWDEYDEVEQFIVKEKDGSYLVSGLTPLEEFGELIGEDFDTEEYDTVNGFLISLLERIPAEDERPTIEWKKYVFSICTIENKMINKVRVEAREC